MSNKLKSPKKLERHFKGVANHRRIAILLLISKRSQIIQEEIIEEFKSNQKTTSEHIRRLYIAGLIDKAYAGRSVQHSLTPYGKKFVDFMRTFPDANS